MDARFEQSVDASQEIALFASFDHPTRRFIAYALAINPPEGIPPAGLAAPENPPLPFKVGAMEHEERVRTYRCFQALRAANKAGIDGRTERRLLLADLIGAARVDLKWKRLPSFAAALFLYERAVGPAWRELLNPALIEAGFQRRSKASPQLPLDPRLRGDREGLHGLESDPLPVFQPSLADADALGLPLLGSL